MISLEDNVTNGATGMAEELGISKAYVAKLVRHSKDRGLLVRDATVRKGGWAVDLERLERM